MREWPRVELGEICHAVRTQVAPHETGYDALPFVGLEQVESDTGAITLVRGSRTGDGRSLNFRFDERQVLYGKLRPYLNKVALPDFKGRCSTELIPLLPAKGIERRFLAALLRRPQTVQAVMVANTGSRMPRTDMNMLFELTVPLPPLEEQRRIVDILDRAASIRRLRRQAQETARQIVPALFVKMFGDPARNPMGWPLVRFGDMLRSGPQNGLYRPAALYGQGTRILRIDSFYDGRVVDLVELRRVQIDRVTIEKFCLTPGDIVINRVNSRPYLGKSTIISAMDEPVVFESNMMRLTLDAERVIPEYVIAYLQTEHARAVLILNAKDAINQSSINQQDVSRLPVPVPPINLQNEFAERVAVLTRISDRQDSAANVEGMAMRSIQAQLLGS